MKFPNTLSLPHLAQASLLCIICTIAMCICGLQGLLSVDGAAAVPNTPKAEAESKGGALDSELLNVVAKLMTRFGGPEPAMGQPISLRFSQENNGDVIEYESAEGEKLVISAETGAPLAFLRKHPEEVPSGLVRNDGIDIPTAKHIIDDILQLVGEAPCGEEDRILYNDVSDREPSDLFGAIYLFRRSYQHEGYRCHDMGISITLSAYSGAVRHFMNKPIEAPSSTTPVVALDAAKANAERELLRRYQDSSITFRDGHHLAIALAQPCETTSSSSKPWQAKLCWCLFVDIRQEEEGQVKQGLRMVYVDAESGVVVTAKHQRNRRN